MAATSSITDPVGKCPNCNSEGVLGCPCSNCGDTAVVYETPWWAAPLLQAGPEPEPDPTVRFVEVLGVKRPMGICIPCQRGGRIGDFCYHCCRKAGMDMGTCFVCGGVRIAERLPTKRGRTSDTAQGAARKVGVAACAWSVRTCRSVTSRYIRTK